MGADILMCNLRMKMKKKLEKENIADTNADNKKDLPEDISAKVMHIMNSLHSSHPEQEMNESKEAVFSRVSSLIDMDKATYTRLEKPVRKLFRPRYTAIVAAVAMLILFIPATYFVGYHYGVQRTTENPIEMSVPCGTISQVTLPDGTTVVLNGGSKLIYPSAFTGKRQVHLSGEAFFDVAKDEKHPFVVRSEQLAVEVLGTRFGLQARKDNHHTILTLEEGSVSASSVDNEKGIMLKPNQQLIMNNATGEFRCQNVDAALYVLWKEDVLNFRDITLSEIAMVLEQRFSVQIDILPDSLRSERYTAQFKYNENAELILEKLSYKRSWRYIKSDGKIQILEK